MATDTSRQGHVYTFSVRSVPSPMAYRARAILPSGGRISGFGNTRADAIRDMQNRVDGYFNLYPPKG
jgi:hypothetical protein